MSRLRTLKPRLASLPSRLNTVQTDSWRANKQSSTARGYGYKWQQARAEYLAEQPFCVFCAREAGIHDDPLAPTFQAQCIRFGVGHANVVDHTVPHRGDMKLFWRRSNWQSLCRTHHSRDKQREESQFPRD